MNGRIYECPACLNTKRHHHINTVFNIILVYKPVLSTRVGEWLWLILNNINMLLRDKPNIYFF